jgi:hypothetical protein
MRIASTATIVFTLLLPVVGLAVSAASAGCAPPDEASAAEASPVRRGEGRGADAGAEAASTSSAATDSGDAHAMQPVGPPQPALPTGLTSGFINAQWVAPLNGTTGYEQASLEIRPAVAGPTEGPLQYFAFGGWRFSSGPVGRGFYGGLQTKIGNNTANGGKRGVIFSTWGVVDAIPNGSASVAIDTVSCDGAAGAVCAQLSLAYPWHSGGAYRLLYKFAGNAPSSPDSRLLRVSVTDLTTKAETVVGDFVIAAAWGGLPADYFTFDETFPPEGGETCQNYHPSDVVYSSLRLGNGVAATTWGQLNAKYTGPCIKLFHYDPVPDGYRMRLGVYAP